MPSFHHFRSSWPTSLVSVVMGFFLNSSSVGPSARAIAARTATASVSALSKRTIFSPPHGVVKAQKMVDAVSDNANGVLIWIKAHW